MDLTSVRWRKSSYSGDNGGNCIEVASAPAAVAVRDSEDPDGPKIVFTPQEWKAFTRAPSLREWGTSPDQGRERRCIHSELMYWPFLTAYSRNVPTSVKPNFRCSATDASLGSAIPASTT